MNLLNKLKDHIKFLRMSTIDKLISICGLEHTSIWNGVNYYGEFTFDDSSSRYDRSKIVSPWLKIRLGRYVSGMGDWGGGFEYTSTSKVALYVDENSRIVKIDRGRPYYNGPKYDRKIDKKIDALLKEIKVGDVLDFEAITTCPLLGQFKDLFFKYRPEVRYAHPVDYNAYTLGKSNIFWMLDNLNEWQKKYDQEQEAAELIDDWIQKYKEINKAP